MLDRGGFLCWDPEKGALALRGSPGDPSSPPQGQRKKKKPKVMLDIASPSSGLGAWPREGTSWNAGWFIKTVDKTPGEIKVKGNGPAEEARPTYQSEWLG